MYLWPAENNAFFPLLNNKEIYVYCIGEFYFNDERYFEVFLAIVLLVHSRDSRLDEAGF